MKTNVNIQKIIIFVNLNTIDEDKINYLYSMVYDPINNFVVDDYINLI